MTTSSASQRLRNLLLTEGRPLFVLVLFGSLLFLPFLFGGPDTILVAEDQFRGLAGSNNYLELIREGTFPQWWPNFLGGKPTYDAVPGDAVYPPYVLMGLLLGDHGLTYGVMFWLHTLLAGAGAFTLARRAFGLNPWTSAFLAALWMLCPHTLGWLHSGHTGKYYILALLPWLHLLLHGILTRPRPLIVVGYALVLGLMLFTSHFQLVYFVLWGHFLFWCASVWEHRKSVRALLARGSAFWAAALLGVGLGAPLMIPGMRYVEDSSVRGTAERTSYEHATSWSMHPEEVAGMVVPEFQGFHDTYWGRNPFKSNTETPGAMLLVLGIAGFFVLPRGPARWAHGLVVAMALTFALGDNTPLFRLYFELIPGVDRFRAPSMIVFWVAMILWLLTATLLKRWQDDDRPSPEAARRWRNAALWSLPPLALAVLSPNTVISLWTSVFSDVTSSARYAASVEAADGLRTGALRVLVVVGGAILLARAWRMGDVRRPALLGGLALLGALDLLVVGSRFVNTIDRDRVFPASRAAAAVAALPSDQPFRILDWPPGAFPGGFNERYKLQTVSGFADNELRWYREFRSYGEMGLLTGALQTPQGLEGARGLDLLNVTWLLVRDPQTGSESVLRNTSALPRAWLADRWESLPESLHMARIHQSDFPYRRSVLVLPGEEPSFAPHLVPDSIDTSAGVARVTVYGPNRVVVAVEAARPSVLVLADNWFRAWHASIGDKEIPVRRINLTLRGVEVPPGSSEVEFTYHSVYFAEGWKIFGWVSLALLLLGASGYLFRRRRASAPTAA